MKKILAIVVIVLTLASCVSSRAGCGTPNSWATNCPAYR